MALYLSLFLGMILSNHRSSNKYNIVQNDLVRGAYRFIDNFDKSANFVKFDLIWFFPLNGRILLHFDAL
jgi:hypothetical protein